MCRVCVYRCVYRCVCPDERRAKQRVCLVLLHDPLALALFVSFSLSLSLSVRVLACPCLFVCVCVCVCVCAFVSMPRFLPVILFSECVRASVQTQTHARAGINRNRSIQTDGRMDGEKTKHTIQSLHTHTHTTVRIVRMHRQTTRATTTVNQTSVTCCVLRRRHGISPPPKKSNRIKPRGSRIL